MRFTRAGVLDVMQSNFVLYERAMGLAARVIVWKYMLRNALTSTVTQIGLLFGILLAGAVVTETVFDWPGIGTYAVKSILQSDYNARHGLHGVGGADLHRREPARRHRPHAHRSAERRDD